MNFSTHYEFTSPLFPPNEGEEETINPGCYGERLANFIAQELTKRTLRTNTPTSEDWGWIVPILDMGYSTWIGCGAVAGEPNRFLCFIEPDEPRWLHLFKRQRVRNGIEKITAALASALQHPDIREVRSFSRSEYIKGA